MSWTDLGDGIELRQSRVYWMNTVVLRSPEHTVIVDPGVLPSELDDLARRARGSNLTLVFTHGDWDHVLGKPWWPNAATLAHDRFAVEIRARRQSILAQAVETATEFGERWERGFASFRPDLAVAGLRFTKLGPWRVVFRDAFGHSATMLSLHLPERRLLIAADMLSDIEIPIIDQSLESYRRTLLELQPLAEHGAIETLIPGHGGVAQGRDEVVARIVRDLDYLDRLVQGVEAARYQGLSLEDTEAVLAGMEYLGKAAEYSMDDYHRSNVRRVYAEARAN